MNIDLPTLLHLLPGHVYWKDRNGTYLGSNDQHAKAVGLKKGSDLIGKTDYDLTWKEQAEQLRKNDRLVMEHGVPVSFYECGKLDDNTLTTTLSYKAPLRDDNGQIVGIIGVSIPLGAKENNKNALIFSEPSDHQIQNTVSFLDNILGASPCSIYWKNNFGVYLGYNTVQQEIIYQWVGKKCQILGKTDYDFFDKTIADQLVRNDQKVIKLGKTLVFEESGTLPDGQIITYISNKTPLRDPEGRIIGILGTSINITAQKNKERDLLSSKEKTEKEKQDSEDYLANIIDYVPAHIYWEDIHGKILGCNFLQAKEVGVSHPRELIGKNILDLAKQLNWSQQSIENIKRNDSKVIQNRKTIKIEEFSPNETGEIRHFISQKAPLIDKKNNCIGVLGISVDISDRKKMEQELKKAKEDAENANRMKTEFIANISHDFRTPVHAITGLIEILKHKSHLPEQQEYFEGIQTSAQSLLKLIESVLDFSKYEYQEIEPQFEPIQLQTFIEKLTHPLSYQAKIKGLKFITQYVGFDVKQNKNALIDPILADTYLLTRIFTNLLGNAIKFTHKGHIGFIVKLLQNKKHFINASFTVKDTGIGIKSNEIENIFERFHRTTIAQNTFQGTGLGLAIVKKLVDRLNGVITVQSEPKMGTEFTCIFKFDHAKTKKINPQQEKIKKNIENIVKSKTTTQITNHSNLSQRPLNILFIEDSELILKFSKDMFQEFGHAVTLATTAKKALKQATAKSFDLIFTDLGLPDEDGVSLIKKIRHSAPNKKTPIIVLTAHSGEELKQQCLEAGATSFLSKPFSVKHLLQTLADFS